MSEPYWELLGGAGYPPTDTAPDESVLTVDSPGSPPIWKAAPGGGGVDYIGDWAVGTTYKRGDVVRYNGIDYLAVNPSTGQVPPTAVPTTHAMVCLFDQILAANAANFDVIGIPQIYAQLLIMAQIRGTDAAGQISNWWRFNNDSGANYYYEYLTAFATTVSSAEGLAQAQIFAGNAPSAAAPAGAAAIFEAKIPNYAGTTFQKAIETVVANRNGTVSTTVRKDQSGGHWASTAAINRLTLYPNAGLYLAGSRLTVYGLRGL